MTNTEAAVVVFSIIFIIINAAIWYLKREFMVICVLFSVFCISMVGSVVSAMDTSGAGSIFDGMMLISGVGFTMALLFYLLGLLKGLMEGMQNHQI